MATDKINNCFLTSRCLNYSLQFNMLYKLFHRILSEYINLFHERNFTTVSIDSMMFVLAVFHRAIKPSTVVTRWKTRGVKRSTYLVSININGSTGKECSDVCVCCNCGYQFSRFSYVRTFLNPLSGFCSPEKRFI